MGQALPKPRLEVTSFLINNFEVTLFSQKTELLIKAVGIFTCKCFYITITSGNIKETTGGIFSDLESLYQGLTNAIDGKDPALKISISEDGKLTFSTEKNEPGLKQTITFTIAMTEAVMEDINKLQSQIESLSKKQIEQESRIAELEKEIENLKKN